MVSVAKRASNLKYDRTPKGRYVKHKIAAARRGIGFEISFEDWWALWEPHWHLRGQGGMVMTRHGDKGPYAVGNVTIKMQAENAKERNSGRV